MMGLSLIAIGAARRDYVSTPNPDVVVDQPEVRSCPPN
jgi:hypothetical protein